MATRPGATEPTVDDLLKEKTDIEAKHKAAQEELAKKDAELKALKEKQVLDPDVTKAIESARKEEKDKLYKQLESLKDKEKHLDTENELLKKKLEDAVKQVSAGKKTEEDDKKTVDQRVAEIEAGYKAELEKVSNAQKQSEERFKEVIRLQELAVYKERRVREAGDLVPDLVGGNTQAEIDASIIKAQETFKAMEAKIAEKLKKETSGNTPTPTPLSPGGSNPGSKDQDALLAEIKSLSPDEWKRRGPALAKQLGLNIARR